MSTITLPNIRVSSDLTVRVRLKDGGVAIDWSTLTGVKAYLYADEQRSIASRCAVSVDEEDSTLLVCQYAASKPQYLGVNRIIVCATYMGETKNYDKPALNFVRWTADQEGEQITIDDPDVDVEIEVSDVSSSILDEAIRAAITAAEEAVDAKCQVLETEAEVEAAEALRVSAEESRVEAEEGRAEAEAARVDEEAVRVSAEDARVVAENARAAAEDLREGAEDDRAAAETARETAEAARVAAEALRVSAEGSRETAEAAREAQASADHTVAAGDHTQAAADHTQAAADHTTAASDHTQAGADHTLAAADHVTAGEDHAQAQDDHEVMAGYDTRLGNVEGEVSQLEAKVDGSNGRVDTVTNFTDTGKFLYGTSGTLDSAQYNITDYLDIENADRIVLTNLWASTGSLMSYVIYDANKSALSANPTPAETGLVNYDLSGSDIPSGAKYIRCTQNTLYNPSVEIHFGIVRGLVDRVEDLETAQEEADEDIDELDERVTTLENTVNADNVPLETERGQVVNIITDFTTSSATHFNTTNGKEAASASFTGSAFIAVSPETQYASGKWSKDYGGYVVVTMQEICYYDESKNFLSAETSKSVITTPEDTAFLRFSVLSKSSSLGENGVDDIAECELVEGATLVSVFDNYIFKNTMPRNGLMGKKWIVIGDSNTEHNARATGKYDEFIRAYTGIIPMNIGKSGAGYRVYENANYVFLNILNAFITANPDYVPDIITIMGGSNDVVYDSANIGTYTDTTSSTVFGMVYLLTERIKEAYPNIPFAIVTPFPHKYDDSSKVALLKEFSENLVEFCKLRNVPCLDLYSMSGIRPEEAAFNAHYFSSPASPTGDGLHLNYYGQKLISPRIREFMMSHFGEL